MDRFNALGRGMQIMLVAGVLLLIDTFFAWQKVTVSILGVEAASVKANAWHGFWGVVMGLLVVVLVAWLVARLAAVDIPLPVSSAMLAVGLAVVILLLRADRRPGRRLLDVLELPGRRARRAGRRRRLASGAGIRRCRHAP